MAFVVRTRSWKALLGACACGTLLLVSACTSNSSFPSPSISAALTPQESDLEKVAENVETPQPKAAVPTTATAEKPEQNSQNTQLALAQTTTEPPSVEATQSAVDSEAAKPTPSQTTEKTRRTEDGGASKAAATEAHTPETGAKTDDRTEEAKPVERKGFLASLFQSSPRKPKRDVGETKVAKVQKPSPRVKLIVRKGGSATSVERGGISGLPGVKRKNIFDIEDETETEEFDEPVRTASIANLATRGTHGLLLQRPGVKVGCFTRPLLRVLKQVERRFKRTPIVTSGYRSPRHNRLVRGAKNSTHMRCIAADIQVKGVSKWQLAKYLRGLPGRGGVGTYCHTKSVHIDVASKRAWHYCRRSRGKRRRKT